MPSQTKNRIDLKSNVIIITIMTVLVLVVTTGFVLLPYFGMYGLYELLEKFGLVTITFTGSILGNLKYFGFLFFIIYLVTLILDLASKAIFLAMRKKFTKGTMILNYVVQALLSTYIFKVLVDYNFTRIDISLVGSFLMFSIIYLFYYVMLDDDDYL